MAKVCVYCSSSDALPQHYRDLASSFGTLLGRNRHHLVYGGTSVGLMGIVARSAKAAGAPVTGILPTSLVDRGLALTEADTIETCHDLRDRKARMDSLADAFVALPGGLGTLEELVEILNLRFLGFHRKPIVLLNHRGFYQPFLNLMEELFRENFTRRDVTRLFTLAETPEEALHQLENAPEIHIDESWYDRSKG